MENPEQTMDVPDDVMIECDSLVKIYKTKDIEVLALQGLDLTVKRGELMAIIGNSGSGKSTFLNMIGGLDRPSAGKLYVDGKNLFQMTENELVKYKRSTVGFVWQNNARNLLPYLTAWENVMTPMLFVEEKEKAVSEEEKKKRALELLELVGLGHRKDSKLSQLSGGEQQRVAIAIALANNPKLLLADEPTGAVDRKTADDILEMFRKLNEKLGLTIVIVTHDKELAKKVNRVVSIRDGKTSSERIMKNDYRERMEHLDIDWQEAAHGRAPAVATAVKRLWPDRLVFTYQGDGDLACIGTAETIHALNRGENITIIFINNAIYGMTGGQMAPTTLIGMKTATCPYGRDVTIHGYPLKMTEIAATLEGTAYVTRQAVHTVAAIRKAKKAIRKAFENSMNGKGSNLVEIVSTCNSGWKMTPQASNDWMVEHMFPFYPLGDLKDKE